MEDASLGTVLAGCLGSQHAVKKSTKGIPMLGYAITFLIIALIAGVLGFTGVMGAAAYIAKILLVVFLVLFVVSLIAGRRPPV
jgi:uncharacterized membrane protein YtjA (UPF0391 family)